MMKRDEIASRENENSDLIDDGAGEIVDDFSTSRAFFS